MLAVAAAQVREVLPGVVEVQLVGLDLLLQLDQQHHRQTVEAVVVVVVLALRMAAQVVLAL
jgi:hypothetical protein